MAPSTDPDPFTLTLSGSSSITTQAELGQTTLTITSTGPKKDLVSAEVFQTSRLVEQLLNPYTSSRSPSPATFTTTTLLVTPHNEMRSSSMTSRHFRGKLQLDVTFRDFPALAEFVEKVSRLERVEVGDVKWVLTPETRAKLETRVRREAAREGYAKAKDYCEEFGGYERIRPVKLKEGTLEVENGETRVYAAREFRGGGSGSGTGSGSAGGSSKGGFASVFSSVGSSAASTSTPAESTAAGMGSEVGCVLAVGPRDQEVKMRMDVDLTFHAE